LHGDLYATPHQEWPEDETETILNEVVDPFLPKACPHKNSRYDEEQWHSETKEENIQELENGMLVGVKNISIGQSFMSMTKANKDDTNPSCIVYPWVTIPG